jgi:DNA processing protein
MGELTAKRRVTAALWSLQGIGPRSIALVEERFGDDCGELLERPVEAWVGQVGLRPKALEVLAQVPCLGDVWEALERKLAHSRTRLAFPGDPAWPPLLTGIDNAPPVLFHWGPGASGRPVFRAAMVGSRHPEAGFLPRARALARAVAELDVGVVSGGAEGVDSACHFGALSAGGETWAFLGSALDELDPPQRALAEPFLSGRGTLFSEYPPGTRPSKANFPRRNRLISGAAAVTVVLRGNFKSGAIHTARAARNQGRPILAVPGDLSNPVAFVPNRLIHDGDATACLSVDDIARALGLSAVRPGASPNAEVPEGAGAPAVPLEELSGGARAVLERLSKDGVDFDALLSATALESGVLAGALTELELSGHAVQRVGRRYERVS